MTHVAGHASVIDRMSHALGIVAPHTNTVSQKQNTSTVTNTSDTLKKGDTVSLSKTAIAKDPFASKNTHSHAQTTGYGDWQPFKSSKTGAAVGAMSGMPFGLVASFTTAAVVAGVSKDYRMAIVTGASVFVASVGAASVGGAVGYKARSMNVDLTEPPMGSMHDSPAQVVANEKKADEVWKKAFKQR